jgi:hypothetical protein
MIDVPKGRGAFIDCVEYLRHSDIRQALKGKYEYPPEAVHANFDWQAEVEAMVLRKTKYEKPLSQAQFVKNEVLYNGMTLNEVCEKYPTLYQEEITVFNKLRNEYLSKFADMPAYRINYYIEAPSGYGKDTMAYSIARSLFPELGDNAYFEVGANKVTFAGYDGEPVIIWSEFRSDTFIKTFGGYEDVLSAIDVIPKAKKRENKKYGDLRLVNSVNIVTSTQPYNEFLEGLIAANDPSRDQSRRRFPIIIPLHANDFDIMINTGYLDAGRMDYHDYKAWKHVLGNFGDIARKLNNRPDFRMIAEKKMTEPIIEAHKTVENGISPDYYAGMSDEEILAELAREHIGQVIDDKQHEYEQKFQELHDAYEAEMLELVNLYDDFHETWHILEIGMPFNGCDTCSISECRACHYYPVCGYGQRKECDIINIKKGE